MTTANVMTVGARRGCPRTQEHRRGSGVAPEPDKWLTMRTVSAGGGHGPNFIREVGTGGGGVNCINPETLIPTGVYREFFYIKQRFLHWACKKSPILVKKCNWLGICSMIPSGDSQPLVLSRKCYCSQSKVFSLIFPNSLRRKLRHQQGVEKHFGGFKVTRTVTYGSKKCHLQIYIRSNIF
jgi:hypothetical protein